MFFCALATYLLCFSFLSTSTEDPFSELLRRRIRKRQSLPYVFKCVPKYTCMIIAKKAIYSLFLRSEVLFFFLFIQKTESSIITCGATLESEWTMVIVMVLEKNRLPQFTRGRFEPNEIHAICVFMINLQRNST